jgi:hypothetical protein
MGKNSQYLAISRGADDARIQLRMGSFTLRNCDTQLGFGYIDVARPDSRNVVEVFLGLLDPPLSSSDGKTSRFEFCYRDIGVSLQGFIATIFCASVLKRSLKLFDFSLLGGYL